MSSVVNTIFIGAATAAAFLQGAEGSIQTCASAWQSVGGPNCATAVAVCAAESGGNPNARNVNSDSHHSVDRGLWQINDYWHPEVSDSCAYNSGCNAQAALKISGGGSNWTPWATYNGGAYKSHLSEARSACGQLAPQAAVVADSSSDSIQDVKPFKRSSFSLDSQAGGQPKSCIKKLKSLCGHCGTSKSCWLSCAKSHESQLLAAGCKKPKTELAQSKAQDQPQLSQVSGQPASCVDKLKAVCGHCGTSKDCWLSCAKSHESELLAAGCKKPKTALAQSKAQDQPQLSQVGGQPASCVDKLKAVCGHCGISKDCWLSCAKSHESELLAAGCKKPAGTSSNMLISDTVVTTSVQTEPLHTTKEIRLHHEYDQHCALLTIPGGKKSKFWKTYGYKYDHFKKGRCPHKYNYINKRVSNIEGFSHVNMQVRGMYKPKRSFREVVAKFGSANACPSDPCQCCPNDGKGPGACPCLCGGGWCKRCCQ